MPKKKIHYLGLLANTDKSILKVQLKHGFRIEAMSSTEGRRLIMLLEKVPSSEAYKKLFIECNCMNSDENKIYFVSRSFGFLDDHQGLINAMTKRNNSRAHFYLGNAVRLMRLFKKGNIFIPCEYYYVIKDNIPRLFMMSNRNLYVSKKLYTLKNAEIPALQKFIQNTRVPLKKLFLQLAFENFELSFHIHDIHLSFLSLMISLEVLFNPGHGEIQYKISRNTAVLLGTGRDNAKKIYDEIRILYNKRSKVIHTGRTDIIRKEDLLALRHYVRNSIRKINKMGKDKDALLNLLTSCGFGGKVGK